MLAPEKYSGGVVSLRLSSRSRGSEPKAGGSPDRQKQPPRVTNSSAGIAHIAGGSVASARQRSRFRERRPVRQEMRSGRATKGESSRLRYWRPERQAMQSKRGPTTLQSNEPSERQNILSHSYDVKCIVSQTKSRAGGCERCEAKLRRYAV